MDNCLCTIVRPINIYNYYWSFQFLQPKPIFCYYFMIYKHLHGATVQEHFYCYTFMCIYLFHFYIQPVTNFIQTITLGILNWFQWSKWPPKALKKTFQKVPKTSQSNQYSLSYQQISQWSLSHQTLNYQYLRNCLT